MADRRGVRSSSRRILPAPQQPPKTTYPQAARRRGTRSASRDVEAPIEPAQTTRRSARQASVENVFSESEAEGRTLSRAKRKAAQKEAIADLTIVEEVDAHIASQPPHASPLLPNTEVAPPRRSLGAVSEMSGTTAISSFTLVEAETLEPRFMLRHLPRLQEEVGEFLGHLVPAHGDIYDDNRRIQQVHDPTSDFFADYHDFDRQLTNRLIHYRGDHQQYIHIRAVHAALFGANRDATAAQTGLDLVLYQANLIVFAKDMIPLDVNDKTTVGALRKLDSSFPSLFLPALVLGAKVSESPAGESALLQESFELALELRTQLAISSLSHGITDESFDPDVALGEIFFKSQSESAHQSGVVRGWDTFALGGDGSALPAAFVQRVTARMTAIREFFTTGDMSQGQDEIVNLDHLSEAFPWAALILRLVSWVRARNEELVAALQQQGGAHGILERVKAERERSTVVAETGRTVPRSSPRKNRSSFGRNGRRSSGRFDPNAEVDSEVLSRLIAREGGAHPHSLWGVDQQESPAEEGGPVAAGDDQAIGSMQQDDDNSHTHQDGMIDAVGQAFESKLARTVTARTVAARPVEQPLDLSRPIHDSIQDSEIPNLSRQSLPESSRPPQSTNDFVSLLKETFASDKENRVMSLFERQANAQRVEFGDGFDGSQSTPGPSRGEPSGDPSRKGKEPQRSSPKKRKVAERSDDDNGDDAFGTIHHSANVQRQRANAPKRVRTGSSSYGAPTSHHPRPREDGDEFRPIEDFEQPVNEDAFEAEAPDMTEEAPPRSTFDDIKTLARANTIRKPRRARRAWTEAEEEALIKYMSAFPRQYSAILATDKARPRKYFHALEHGQWIAQRSQTDLKDKARVMAKQMIQSGAGLRPGFDGVITPAMERQLRDDGWEW